jgi:hypothetical protein
MQQNLAHWDSNEMDFGISKTSCPQVIAVGGELGTLGLDQVCKPLSSRVTHPSLNCLVICSAFVFPQFFPLIIVFV